MLDNPKPLYVVREGAPSATVTLAPEVSQMLVGFPDLMTAEQVSWAFQVTTKTVYKWADAGTLPAVRIERELRFPKARLIEFLAEKELEGGVG